ETVTSILPATTARSFMKLAQSKDPNDRCRAYAKLASPYCYDEESQKVEAAKLLSAALVRKKEPAAARALICHTVGILGKPEARNGLLVAVRDDEPMVRAEALRAIGKVGKPEDAALLSQGMFTGTIDCQVAAIEGLGELKAPDPHVAEMLVDGME